MTDQDIIRKGVVLADAWILYESGDKLGPEYSAPHRIEDCWLCDICQEDKDALAAQLVRQVDVTGSYWVRVLPNSTTIFSDPSNDALQAISGDDRTMNTLRAIVDSKALT